MFRQMEGQYGKIFYTSSNPKLLIKEIDETDEMSCVRDTAYYTNLGHEITLTPSKEDKLNIGGIRCMGKNLQFFLHRNDIQGKMLYDFLRKFCSSVYKSFMAGLVQGDCKPDNICVVFEDGILKEVNIIDGTLCKHALSHVNDMSDSHCAAYRSPECLYMSCEPSEDQKFYKDALKDNSSISHEKAQVWAMGCVLLYVITKKHVFLAQGEQKIIEKIVHNTDIDGQHVDVESLVFHSSNSTCHVDLRFTDILKKMLSFNPRDRIGVCELINILNEEDLWQEPSLDCQLSAQLRLASQTYVPVTPICWKGLNAYLDWILKYKDNKYVPVGGLASSLVIFQDLGLDLKGCPKCIKSVLSHCLIVASYLMSSSLTVVSHAPLTCYNKKCCFEASKVNVQYIMSNVKIDMWKLVSHPFHLQMQKNYQRPKNFNDFVKPTGAEIESIVAHNSGVINPFYEELVECDVYHYQEIISYFGK